MQQKHIALLLALAVSVQAQQAPTAGAVAQQGTSTRDIILARPLEGQNIVTKTPVPLPGKEGYWNERLLNNYRYPVVSAVSFRNSDRISRLLRAGRLYLGLQDAIALALENNLDIYASRLNFEIAKADLLRAEGGGALRGIPAQIRQGANSAVANAIGTGGANTGSSGLQGGGAADNSQANVGGAIITQTGTAIPNYDEQIFATWTYGRIKRPQANAFVTGVNFLESFNNNWNFGFSKGFSTGASIQVGLNNSTTDSNNRNLFINPFTSSSNSVQFTQPLLQGFGARVNKRNIYAARNNLAVTDLSFKQQVITTVQSIINLYSDLVSFSEDVRVKRQALAYAEKLYNDNQKQVEIGTLAPIEVVRAEAEVAARQQDLTISETQLLQQEVIIKNALSRSGVADPSLAEARIVPIDKLVSPVGQKVEPIQDLVERALRARPEIEQTRINLETSKLQLEGSRSLMRPQLNFVASGQTNAQAGTLRSGPLPPNTPPPPETFVGGYSNILRQLYGFTAPDYNIGFQFVIPLRNRVAKADAIRDQLSVRQAEINQQVQVNSIRVAVSNALIQVQQAEARYQAAVKTRVLQEQSLDAEQKKYALGASTIFFVIQAQRDLANAQGQEVAALNAYNRAKVALDVSTGSLLDTFGVDLEEARTGEVKRAPSDPIGP